MLREEQGRLIAMTPGFWATHRGPVERLDAFRRWQERVHPPEPPGPDPKSWGGFPQYFEACLAAGEAPERWFDTTTMVQLRNEPNGLRLVFRHHEDSFELVMPWASGQRLEEDLTAAVDRVLPLHQRWAERMMHLSHAIQWMARAAGQNPNYPGWL